MASLVYRTEPKNRQKMRKYLLKLFEKKNRYISEETVTVRVVSPLLGRRDSRVKTVCETGRF